MGVKQLPLSLTWNYPDADEDTETDTDTDAALVSQELQHFLSRRQLKVSFREGEHP